MKEIVRMWYSGRTEAEVAMFRRVREMSGDLDLKDLRRQCAVAQAVRGSAAHRLFEEMVERFQPAESITKDVNYDGSVYSVSMVREWEPHDFESAEFMSVEATLSWGGFTVVKKTFAGAMLYVDATAVGEDDLGQRALGAESVGVTVDEAVRAACERAHFVGIEWIPVELVIDADSGTGSEVVPWPEGFSRYWGLFSSMRLPPASPSMLRHLWKGYDPAQRPELCKVYDSTKYEDIQLRYRRSDLAIIGDSDVMYTFEGGDCGFDVQAVVISKRVYDLFARMQLPLTYAPVVIEE